MLDGIGIAIGLDGLGAVARGGVQTGTVGVAEHWIAQADFSDDITAVGLGDADCGIAKLQFQAGRALSGLHVQAQCVMHGKTADCAQDQTGIDVEIAVELAMVQRGEELAVTDSQLRQDAGACRSYDGIDAVADGRAAIGVDAGVRRRPLRQPFGMPGRGANRKA